MRQSNVARSEIEQQALTNATTNQSTMNYRAILEGFSAMGIPMEQITPRENVFTYNAWRALGRQVRKGEHGVRVVTFVPMSVKDETKESGRKLIGRRPRTTTVFHVSQTEAIQ